MTELVPSVRTMKYGRAGRPLELYDRGSIIYTDISVSLDIQVQDPYHIVILYAKIMEEYSTLHMIPS